MSNEGDPATTAFVDVVGYVTFAVFTIECVLKIVAEGKHPEAYFTHPQNGTFNTFDACIVVASFAFLGNSNGGAIGALRMLRLVRLLTFIKGVQQLRVIVVGLIQGMRSVTYIVLLLFLVIYLFAIMVGVFLPNSPPPRKK